MGPLLSNELPVPPKDGVGSDERSNFGERASANPAGHGGDEDLPRLEDSYPAQFDWAILPGILFGQVSGPYEYR